MPVRHCLSSDWKVLLLISLVFAALVTNRGKTDKESFQITGNWVGGRRMSPPLPSPFSETCKPFGVAITGTELSARKLLIC